MNFAKTASADPRWRRLTPYLLISLASLVSHGLLLTNDGTIWDSWYVLNILQTRNWATLHEFFGSVGIPLYGWLYRAFAWLPDIVAGFMWATFLCLLANGVLIYQLGSRLGRLTQSEALVLALLAQTMPLFSAAQDFIMFFFVFTQMLFLSAALLAARMIEMSGMRGMVVRGLSAITFYFAFTNAALLVFYGCFYLLLFFHHNRLQGVHGLSAFRRFVSRYPEFLLLPPATWAVRPLLTPQYGWYERYNNPIANLADLGPNFLSFFANALPYHLKQTAAWPVAHPFATVTMATIAVLLYRLGPKEWCVKRGALSTVHLFLFGAAALLLAVFPFAAAGKWFSPIPLGEDSRHAIFTAVPVAILCLATLRLLFLSRASSSRWLPPIVGCFALILGTQLAPVYLSERAQWIYSRALLHNAIRNDAVRNSSVIVLQGYSLVKQNAYGVYGFGSAFGEMTRLVTAQTSANRQFFTPTEIEKLLLYTTLLPGNFRRIDPAGQQILLQADRVHGAATDWEIVSRYLNLRYLGTGPELEDYLTSLVALKSFALKPATALVPAVGLPQDAASVGGASRVDFTNRAAMRMVQMPAGWWASKFETTQAQYRDLMASNPSLFVDPARPVESVTWHEAVAFCDKVTTLEARAASLPAGFVYRLPTSEEFEYLAAGTTLNSAVTATEGVAWHTAPVGSRPPGPTGLHDVFGNVWEWSLDWGDHARRLKTSNGGSWVDHAAELSYPAGPRAPVNPYFDRVSGPVRRDYPDQGFWNRGFRCLLAHPVSEPAAANVR